MAAGLYRAMAAQRSVASCGLQRLVIFGAFFTRGRQRFAALHVATLVYSVIIEISKSLVSGARSRRLKRGLRCIAFRLIAALSFCTTSMPWCTPIFPRTFSLRVLSPSAS